MVQAEGDSLSCLQQIICPFPRWALQYLRVWTHLGKRDLKYPLCILYRVHTKNCNHFWRTFQRPPTRNLISQIEQKCKFPVHSNRTLRFELFAPPNSLIESRYAPATDEHQSCNLAAVIVVMTNCTSYLRQVTPDIAPTSNPFWKLISLCLNFRLCASKKRQKNLSLHLISCRIYFKCRQACF